MSRRSRRLNAARCRQGRPRCRHAAEPARIAVALMLAVTSLGAIWSSCSPDFGERGVLDRFGQIEPKVFLAVDGYWYNGKPIDLTERADRHRGVSCRPHRRWSSFPI